MKKTSLLSLLTSVLVTSLNPAALAADTQTYHRSCHLDEGDALTTDITDDGSVWTITHTAFEEDLCQNPYLVYEVKFGTDKNSQNIDLTVQESSYIPVTEEVAMALNLINYCGYTDWAPKEKKVVSGYLCDEFKAPNVGDKLYTIFKTEQKDSDTLLYIGRDTEEKLGKTPASRHTSWDKRAFKLQKTK